MELFVGEVGFVTVVSAINVSVIPILSWLVRVIREELTPGVTRSL